jgi:hypothetical protein
VQPAFSLSAVSTMLKKVLSTAQDIACTIVLSPLPRNVTAGCCQDPEHAPNQGNFRSTFISGLERTRKNIKQLLERANMPRYKVLNPLWLLADPKKLPEGDILNIMEEGSCSSFPLDLREDGLYDGSMLSTNTKD